MEMESLSARERHVYEDRLLDANYLYHQQDNAQFANNPNCNANVHPHPRNNYFNSNYANLDTICGFDNVQGYQRQGQSQGQASGYGVGGGNCQNINGDVNIHARLMRTVDPNTGPNCPINIKVPCAYNFQYVPATGKEKSKSKLGPRSRQKSKQKNGTQKQDQQEQQKRAPRSRSCPRPQPSSSGSACLNPRIEYTLREKNQNHRAFCSTVLSHNGPPRQGYIAKPLPQPDCGDPPLGKNKTTMRWDFEAGVSIPVKKVDYGEELYEKAAMNLAKHLQLQKISEDKDKDKRKSRKEKKLKPFSSGMQSVSASAASSVTATTSVSGSQNSVSVNAKEKDKDDCYDFSKPGFNSSLQTSVDLAKALERLKKLPEDMQRIFKADKRFEPEIMTRATKALNMSRESKVFRDLVPMNPDDSLKEQVSKTLMEQVQSVKPASRSRDLEPNIMDDHEISLSRIKVKSPSSTPKVQSGTTVVYQEDHHLSSSSSQLEFASDRI